jgi:pimeloyl-ACP methyl ester carboxylesterase
MTTSYATSKDGTTLAVDTIGTGSPVVLIGGAFNDRTTVAALADTLAPHHTVVTYDRRGRSGSTDHSDEFRVQNEIDDIAAVIAHVGGRAALFGHSSGAILAIEAALHGLPVDRIAVYEPPYRADPDLPHPPASSLEEIKALVVAKDGDGAAEYFLTTMIGVPPQGVAMMRAGDEWPFLTDKALTLPYDVLVARPWELVDRGRLATVGVPVLALYGDRTSPGLAAGSRAVAESVPNAELVVIPGEDHGVLAHPEKIEPALTKFFG